MNNTKTKFIVNILKKYIAYLFVSLHLVLFVNNSLKNMKM